ncbi:NUDIX hydrolase [Microbulbifer hydrolyticus]|uniref:ADP-ribose pyrophosphatase YjhB (NUDIX family) n=1 Tax=Microbulbifer hydrolyticus TaxID=48074 RepID=A0A6P1T889_9GAMM|nr:NUDIX domain-containing protein [Microbulbifer hydrolyticus]MBB5211304.1 ADP-ribose pyrophosphatase YjhB (NUDIX family) [Microbulbifer hydrolyticus]QHQ37935.1 NUDIX domain-containing protein [Microbulbifer hydrolyticus]
MRSFLKKAVLLLLALAVLVAVTFVAFPGLKYEIYRKLPPKMRWNISYALTDKFVVGMVYFVERNNQLLLVRHTYQDKWALPGGWVERNESFEESARRELDEELNIKIDDFEVLEVNKVPRSGIINIAIRGRLKEKHVTIRDGEIYGYRFFDLHHLPDDVIYTHKPYIKRYLEARRPPRQLPPEEPAPSTPPERQSP